jgi:hypothetical protein
VTVSSTIDTSTKLNKQGDTMTGALSLPANSLVAGTSQLVLAGGNVGIGTTAPGHKLEVTGGIRSSVSGPEGGVLVLTNPSKTAANSGKDWALYNMTGGYGDSLQFFVYDSTGCTGSGLCASRMTLKDNGNVGIGTTNPSYKLDVAGNVRIGTTTGATTVEIGDIDTAEWRVSTGGYGLSFSNDFDNNGTYDTRVYYSNNGNVGVGTTNPAATLHVNGTVIANNVPKLTRTSITTGSIVCDSTYKSMTAMTFTGNAGQAFDIMTVHNGRLNAAGHHYNDLFLDGVLVDSGGVYSANSWRSQVHIMYSGVLSTSGTHTVQIRVHCGSGATSMTDNATEWPNGGLQYRVWVGG